jgi:hypothetical protein
VDYMPGLAEYAFDEQKLIDCPAYRIDKLRAQAIPTVIDCKVECGTAADERETAGFQEGPEMVLKGPRA